MPGFFQVAAAASKLQAPVAPSEMSLIGVSEASSTNMGDGFSIPFPAGTQAGHVCVLLICSDNATGTKHIPSPSGWSEIFSISSSGAGVEVRVVRKTLDAADISAGSVFVLSDLSYIEGHGYALVFDGVNTSSPIDVYNWRQATFNTNFLEIYGVSPSYSDGIVFAWNAFDGGDGDPFTVVTSGWTKYAEFDVPQGSTSGGTLSGVLAFKDSLSQAGVNTGAIRISSNVSDSKVGVLIVMRKS